MPDTCCVLSCKNRRGEKDGLSFYRIPAEEERRKKWLVAIKRGKWTPTKHTRLCSEHFISGKKCDHPLSPDYIPSIFGKGPSPHTKKNILQKFANRQAMKRKRVEEEKRQTAAAAILELAPNNMTQDKTDYDESEETCKNARCKVEKDRLNLEVSSLRHEVFNLKQKMKKTSFDQNCFEGDDEKVKSFTGVPSFSKLITLFDFIKSHLKLNSTLTPFQQFVLTLMRLRLNLPLSFLGYLFFVSTSTISRSFNNTVNVMYSRLVPILVFWPEREQLRATLPMCFRSVFSKCACIIDCFEIFIERPGDLRARAQTWSQYKHHHTMKYLIGISPQGVVIFISKGWGGGSSDKFVTQNSGFLNKISSGDVILADRGFDVGDEVGLYNAQLKIPAFTKGKKQLDPTEIESTRGLATVRIHVERVIGVVRQKYTILEGTIPISLCESEELGQPTPLDKIVHICCALTNVCPSVVPSD